VQDLDQPVGQGPQRGVVVRAGQGVGRNCVASRVDATRLNAAFTILLIAVAAYSLIRGLPGLVLPQAVRS
jgi:hypothetical protein